MPYVSDKQRKFFHTNTAKGKGITAKVVKEFDQASKGMDLPEKASENKHRTMKDTRHGYSGKI